MASVSSAGWDRRGGRILRPTSALSHGRVFRLGDELPGPGHAGEPVAALGLLVVRGQLFERSGQLALLHLLEPPDGFIALGVLDRGGEHVAEFLQAERLLRREQQRFQNEFQFHAI